MKPLSQISIKEQSEYHFSGPKVMLDDHRLSNKLQRQYSDDLCKGSLYIQSNNYVDVVCTPNAINTARNNRVTKRMLTRRKKEENNQKLVDNQVFKTLAKDRLVKQFKRNLFIKSYVMSQEYKGVIQNHFKYEQNSSKRVEFNSEQQDKQIFLIPGSKFTLILDLLSLIIKIICLWMSPLIVSFSLDDDIFKWFQIGIMFQIIIEVIIQTNRPINIQGETITNQRRILSNYIQYFLIEDIIDLSCWVIQFFNINNLINSLICGIIILVSLKKLTKNYSNCIETMFLKGSFNYAIDLFTLIITILTFVHLMGCIMYYVGYLTMFTGQSWLLKYSIADSSFWIQYNYSIYWAITTMVTVGYGDITATNQYEMMFVNFMMLLSSGMFAYSINSIGMILKSNYDIQQKFKRSLILINNYMKKGQLSQPVQNRVRNYLKYYLLTENNENFDEIKEIITHLPTKLKQELTLGIQMSIMSKISVLNHNFSSQILNQLSQKMEQIKCIPDEIIYNNGDQDDQYLYYLQDGEVYLCEDRSNKLLQIINTGESFGEYQFFTGFKTQTQAISHGHSTLYRIHRNSFIKLFTQISNKDFQRFHNIKDSIIFLNNYQVILKKCNFCNLYNHANIECPLITYQPNKFKIVMQPDNNINQVMLRMKHQRVGDKINSLLIHNKVIESVQDYVQTRSITEFNDPQNRIMNIHQQQTGQINNQQIQSRQSKQITQEINQSKFNLINISIKKAQKQSLQGTQNLLKKKTQQIKNKHRYQSSLQNFSLKKQNSVYLSTSSQFLTINELDEDNQENQEQLDYLYAHPQQINLCIDKHYNYQGYMQNDNIFFVIKKLDKHKMKNSRIWNLQNKSQDGGIYVQDEYSIIIEK
ncbi:unnamed protein product [Paramecium primaurelia]|uniref:Cyclic nucleotide-binding domain-containing protein n=1 Tax=Paramecium primaurelia TaxID=5886 RepID=A0A8S1KJ75_PARPR|nr:unnamed protein product [Paramecium primaurelia]